MPSMFFDSGQMVIDNLLFSVYNHYTPYHIFLHELEIRSSVAGIVLKPDNMEGASANNISLLLAKLHLLLNHIQCSKSKLGHKT